MWHAAALQRCKRLPAYPRFYRRPARRVSAAELAAKRAAHQEMVAAYRQHQEQPHE